VDSENKLNCNWHCGRWSNLQSDTVHAIVFIIRYVLNLHTIWKTDGPGSRWRFSPFTKISRGLDYSDTSATLIAFWVFVFHFFWFFSQVKTLFHHIVTNREKVKKNWICVSVLWNLVRDAKKKSWPNLQTRTNPQKSNLNTLRTDVRKNMWNWYKPITGNKWAHVGWQMWRF